MAATTLPAINLGAKVGHPVHQKPQAMSPTPPPGKPGTPRLYVVQKKRTQSKKDKELEQRRDKLRAEMPDLSKGETAA